MSNEPTAAELFTAAVGDRVKEWRESVNQSRADLAGLAGISVSHLGKIERGKVAATITTMQGIATALGAETWELLDVDGEDLGVAAQSAKISGV